MKVIVTGATGFVGREAVAQCIADPTISEVIVLTRREIDASVSHSPKVQVIFHHDFETYPQGLIEQLRRAKGCIWCLGGKVEDFPNLETAWKVGVAFPLAAANAFVEGICPGLKETGEKFRFVFCSGRGAEWDQDKKLWVFADTRKLKGAAERGLLDIAAAHPDVFEAVVLRPGGVTPDASVLLTQIAGFVTPVVPVSQLAKALVRACVHPPKEKVVENDGIVKLAA